MFLLDCFTASPPPLPGAFHFMASENNARIENCSISVTLKPLNISANMDTSNAATEEVVPSRNSSSNNDRTHKVKAHHLSREPCNNISGSDFVDTAKLSYGAVKTTKFDR